MKANKKNRVARSLLALRNAQGKELAGYTSATHCDTSGVERVDLVSIHFADGTEIIFDVFETESLGYGVEVYEGKRLSNESDN